MPLDCVDAGGTCGVSSACTVGTTAILPCAPPGDTCCLPPLDASDLFGFGATDAGPLEGAPDTG